MHIAGILVIPERGERYDLAVDHCLCRQSRERLDNGRISRSEIFVVS
jgi:hypothetical protein